MQSNKENFVSLANKTSSSFYSTSSFNRRLHTMSTYSNTRNIEKYSRTSLNNYHKAYLKHKLSTNEKYLTVDTERNPIFITKMINFTDLFLDDNEINERYKTLSKESFIPIKLSKFNIYHNLSPRKENIIDFRNLIRSGRKAKIYFKILEKEKNNLLESKKFEIENLEMKFFEINYVKNLLNKYTYQLGKYCKFLNKRIEKENLSLRKILLHELEIKNLVNELRTKVEHKKRIVLEGENYRNFLLCVKYKVTKMKDLPIDVIKLYRLEKYLPIINQPKKIITKRNSMLGSRKSFESNIRRRSSFIKKRSSIILNKNSATDKAVKERSVFKKEEIILPPPPLIYNSVVYFDHDFENIKNELYKLFTYNNEQIKELSALRNERNSLLDTKKVDEDKKTKIIKDLEFKLKHVKDENSYLEQSLKSINLTKLKTEKIYNKIKNIITKLPINVEKEYNCPNFYFHLISKDDYFLYKGYKYDTILYGLSILEQILSSTITKINAFNKGIKNSLILSEVKSKLDKEKRLKISKINMKLEKEKRIKMNENIIHKINKVLFLPRRKVNTIVNKEAINSRNKTNKKYRNSNTYDINIENLLY